jgi:sulfoxide reductase heme-binding subunit YedZ
MLNLRKNWAWYLVNLLALLPLVLIITHFNYNISGDGPIISAQASEFQNASGFARHKLSSFGLLLHLTGEWAMRMLTVCLTITPLMILSGWKILRYRKLFGLYAFFYSALHTLFFIADKGILKMFDEYNFILGLIALLIMLPLAVTSNKWSMKFMGRMWKPLQKAVYAAAILAVIHIAIIKELSAWLPYAVILGIGFILRVPVIKNFLVKGKSSVPQPSAS